MIVSVGLFLLVVAWNDGLMLVFASADVVYPALGRTEGDVEDVDGGDGGVDTDLYGYVSQCLGWRR